MSSNAIYEKFPTIIYCIWQSTALYLINLQNITRISTIFRISTLVVFLIEFENKSYFVTSYLKVTRIRLINYYNFMKIFTSGLIAFIISVISSSENNSGISPHDKKSLIETKNFSSDISESLIKNTVLILFKPVFIYRFAKSAC